MNKHVRVGVAALAMSCALALSAQASARTHDTANTTAGAVFHDQFGESCHVESG